jgi:two-component system chemotaxis sensor kinase CheA
MEEEKRDESLLEMFVFETLQNTEQLEGIILNTEKDGKFSDSEINEIFRITHTLKGSAAMMSFSHLASLAHRAEDLFYYLRDNPDANYDLAKVSDLVLSFIDYVNSEVSNIKENKEADTSRAQELADAVGDYLSEIKTVEKSTTMLADKMPTSKKLSGAKRFKVVLHFEEGCEMENIRAWAIMRDLSEYANVVSYIPENIMDDDDGIKEIRQNGFVMFFESDKSYDELYSNFSQTPFIKDTELSILDNESNSSRSDATARDIILPPEKDVRVIPNEQSKVKSAANSPSGTANEKGAPDPARRSESNQPVQSIISVNISKLDKLMNLVGEVVIAESMVVENSDLKGLELESFHRDAQRLHKLIVDMQETVMSLRLVPLATTFQKTNRIVRDMSRKLGKEVALKFVGEETEVDKNVIEHLSDPLLHIVRNSIDHGIEDSAERIAAGKPAVGTVSIEAYNAGGDVYIVVRDDGRGLNKEKILEKARKNNLLKKPEQSMTDREIYNLIFIPGFSTKEGVTEFSGRGVGMDVVMQNILAIGGIASVDSIPGNGTTVTMKIPLTVAIIDGMNLAVGDSCFTFPISSIRESFKPDMKDIIHDSDGNEMIMLRGECYAIIRLHKQFNIETQVDDLSDGILIVVEQDDKKRCVFVDRLIGQQQVVVKNLPEYIKKIKLVQGISGCTLLGDGSISLILDAGWLLNSEIV